MQLPLVKSDDPSAPPRQPRQSKTWMDSKLAPHEWKRLGGPSTMVEHMVREHQLPRQYAGLAIAGAKPTA